MNREQLEHAVRAAGAICGDSELYVVGSQAILATCPDAHPDLRRSMEVDIAPKNYPEREALIEGCIGELSPFHQTFGYYVDGVDITAIVLPRGWQFRLVVIDNANTNGVRALCIEPCDLAVSKIVAGRSKDLEFIRVLLREQIVLACDLKARLSQVSSLSEQRAHELQRTVDGLA